MIPISLTHFGHACLLVETASARVLIDPGPFSSGFEESNVDAVLITHRHFDHFNTKTLGIILAANPTALLWLESSTELEPGDGIDAGRIRLVRPGDTFHVGATEIQAVGGIHACIHPDICLVPNVGYFFPAEQFLHPGDEFVLLESHIRVLAAPISGPWQSLEDVVDYVRAVEPDAVVPIHEAILSRPEIYVDYIEKLKPSRTVVRRLSLGAPTAL